MPTSLNGFIDNPVQNQKNVKDLHQYLCPDSEIPSLDRSEVNCDVIVLISITVQATQ